MPHTNNKKPRKGNHGSSTPTRGGGRGQASDSNFGPFNGASGRGRGGQAYRAFTLQEEARNTERHHSWDSDQRLRDTKVSFISAGSLDPTNPPENPPTLDEPTEPTTSLAQMALRSAADMIIVEEEVEEEIVVKVYKELYVEEPEEEDLSKGKPEHDHQPQVQDLFVIDTHGNLPVNTGLPPPRVSSPTPSNSSEEVILFAGRDQNGRGISRPRPTTRTISDPIAAQIKWVEKQIQEQEEILQEVLREESAADFEVPIRKRGGRANAAARPYQSDRQTEEDALLADYVANMDTDFTGLETFGRRELGGGSDDGLSDEGSTKSRNVALWDHDNIDDFDDLSTSDGVMGEVSDILSRRRRAAGVQYLVVWEDQSVDEARWVPITTLSSITALLKIQEFETEERLGSEFEGNSEDDSEESDETGDEDFDINAASIPQVIARFSDEQIARMLAKQEELGMGSNELLLYDGEGNVNEDDIPFTQPSIFAGPKSKRSLKGKGKGKAVTTRRARGEFPVTSALADAYDGFDIMDFERRSVQRKSKGRKGKIIFDISDSSLEEAMEKTYENDRIKKKARKQEREELRVSGLLGSKSGKPDMKQRYKEGMSMTDIRNEIKDFLDSDHTTIALPPMEKDERKIVHGIANSFKLKSKSDGAGKKRFPILTKTARTKRFMEGTFNSAGSSRNFLPRPDVKNSGRKARGAGGLNMASVSYRDGDVVGGSAPELGVENRGRAMLEKMGWSTGDALGALNNKGILQPVAHIVKTSKAGLG